MGCESLSKRSQLSLRRQPVAVHGSAFPSTKPLHEAEYEKYRLARKRSIRPEPGMPMPYRQQVTSLASSY